MTLFEFGRLRTRASLIGLALLLAVSLPAPAQPNPERTRQFRPGTLNRLEDLPAGRFRNQTTQLRPVARQRALEWLRDIHFTEIDLDALHTDADGGVYFVDEFTTDPAAPEIEPPVIAEAAVPVSPFPASLIFHSRPGAPNVLYLNFVGETVTGTAWNTSLGRTSIPAVGFSSDSDFSTFSDSEQQAIKRIWQRVAEDFAPFNIDVTTERPATFTTRTAHALITRNTDANGDPNPSSSAGGVAYVNVFASGSFATYRPAWVYYNNLGNNESYIAEAASHEIGHNLGLSHDAKTDGTSYYGGHGTGDISWGPLMGTGYNRNVSQWSKGDYYLANNTEDDLAIIAGKLSYRADDHGNTRPSATALTLTDGTNIVSTTPETDPHNTNQSNKGVLEQRTDVDVFSFVTGSGAVSLSVKPWVMPSGTRGGNLDVVLELYDESGFLLLTNNVANKTDATIATTLPEGLYYLYVRNTGTGDPLATSPSGYTDYASIGQYFISGAVTPSGYNALPQAELASTDVNQIGAGPHSFTVTYTDNLAINVSTLDGNDLRITGPNGFDRPAEFVSVDVAGNGTPRVVTYAIDPPSGSIWTDADNGTYTVWLQTNQVSDTEGGWATAQSLGEFQVNVPHVIFADYLNVNSGWTLQSQWQFGVPTYPGTGPTAGYTGTNIIGFNLSGNYPNNLSAAYAVTPVINCANAHSLTLRFARWLRLRSGDTASIQVTTNGSTWTSVWSTTATTSDSAWQPVEYTLPASVANSATVQLRWGLSSGSSQNDIGWNIDDIQIIGVATAPAAPEFVLNATVNNPAWGTVNPTNGAYASGATVPLTATPAPYFRFAHWTGDATGTNNPVLVSVTTNKNVQAVFAELLTTNHPTPYWWLASHGYTQNPEAAVLTLGSNDMSLWQSYIAGLNPNDPNSQLLLTLAPAATSNALALSWNTVTGRLYTVWSSSNPTAGFTPIPSAIDLPASINGLTNAMGPAGAMFYRLEVRLP